MPLCLSSSYLFLEPIGISITEGKASLIRSLSISMSCHGCMLTPGLRSSDANFCLLQIELHGLAAGQDPLFFAIGDFDRLQGAFPATHRHPVAGDRQVHGL